MDENYRLVSDYAAAVQQRLNEKAKIGIKAQVPEENQDRVDGLVEMASNAEQYDRIAGKLLAGFENFSQNIVDETIKANAESTKPDCDPESSERRNGNAAGGARAWPGNMNIRMYPAMFTEGTRIAGAR